MATTRIMPLHVGKGRTESRAISDIIDYSRYVLYSVISDSSKYIVAGTHLPSNPHTDADGRKMVIRELIADLKEQEKIHSNKK